MLPSETQSLSELAPIKCGMATTGDFLISPIRGHFSERPVLFSEIGLTQGPFPICADWSQNLQMGRFWQEVDEAIVAAIVYQH
ncbi:hypothetical protein BpHYR1_000660 [Brachionus plicatilis]|uniref:Uncharacterized protein n=1 Tax=Brachionus plicatilis TaxID=10195 RepID=A0A3M7SGY5_BRAPC|nr:hypothetical protein BpHYR1_000660 [Brachionus plicatilis]